MIAINERIKPLSSREEWALLSLVKANYPFRSLASSTRNGIAFVYHNISYERKKRGRMKYPGNSEFSAQESKNLVSTFPSVAPLPTPRASFSHCVSRILAACSITYCRVSITTTIAHNHDYLPFSYPLFGVFYGQLPLFSNVLIFRSENLRSE